MLEVMRNILMTRCSSSVSPWTWIIGIYLEHVTQALIVLIRRIYLLRALL
jgi:hypothetical protein